MPKTAPKAPLVDRPLDPTAPERVSMPGVGVVVTMDSDIKVLLREAADVARVRNRLIYVFIVVNELDELRPDFQEWQDRVYLKCHALKAERVKIPAVTAQESLALYCREFDIRILMMQENESRRLRWPWTRTLVERISNDTNLPPTFVLRQGNTAQRKYQDNSNRTEWILLGTTLFILALYGLFARDFLAPSFNLMVYILFLAILSSRVRQIVSVIASFAAAMLYNYIHEPPFGIFKTDDPSIWLNLVGLTIVSLIISTLSWQLRSTLKDAQMHERRKTSFFNLTRDLLQSTDMDNVLRLIERHIRDVIGSEIAVFVKRGESLEILRTVDTDLSLQEADIRARDLALEKGVEAGIGTQTFPLAHGLYLPLGNHTGFSGCLAVYPESQSGAIPPDQLRILDTFTGLLGLALERIWSEDIRLESEQKVRDASLQNTVLKSVSHDLKTPLTSITGFANQLYEDPDMPLDVRRSTYQTIRDEAWRLTNMVNNLLSMTKLESGALILNREPMFVEEIFGTAIGQVRPRLVNHSIEIDLPEDIPDINVDPILMNQALVNLVENAIKYTPAGTKITLRARPISTGVQISVLDDGPGLDKGSLDKIFEKFVRSVAGRDVEGTGLGLAIVRAIAELHGGTATARNRTTKGARFDIRLPESTVALKEQTIA